MDIYTTSFCLPRPAASSADLVAVPSSSFDLAPTSPLSPRHSHAHRHSHRPSVSDGAVAVSPTTAGPADATSVGGSAGAAASGHSTSSSVGSVGAPGPDASSALTGGAGSANGKAKEDGAASSSSATSASAAADAPAGVGPSASERRTSVDFNDAMQRLCVETMAAHQCIASFATVEPTSPVIGAPTMTFPPPTGSSSAAVAPRGSANDKSGRLYNVHLSGGYQQVMAARGHILRESPFLVSSSSSSSPTPPPCLAPTLARLDRY